MYAVKKKLKLYGIILSASIIVYISILQILMYQYSHIKPSVNADYIIVLGARVDGTVPSLSLQYRIDTAADYLKQHAKTIAIVSGGKGSKERISEAAAMQQGLIEQGIAKSRIILEDQSTNTKENIQFSKNLIPEDAEAGLIVTNDYHLYRALSIAREQGLYVQGLQAGVPKTVLVKSYIREYGAITKYFLSSLTQ